jgi:hypothetical protein
MLHLMKSLLGIVEMMLLKERLDLPWRRPFIVKGRKGGGIDTSNDSYITIQMPLVKRTSIKRTVLHGL